MDEVPINWSDISSIQTAFVQLQEQIRQQNAIIDELRTKIGDIENARDLAVIENGRLIAENRRLIRDRPVSNKRGNSESASAADNINKMKKTNNTDRSTIQAQFSPIDAMQSTSQVNTNGASASEVSVRNINDNNNNNWTKVTTKTQRKAEITRNNNASSASGVNADKVTPIQLEKMDPVRFGALRAQLSVGNNNLQFSFQHFGANKHPRIFCQDESAKISIMEHLQANDIQFNTYNSATTRNKAFIVRGLCYEKHDEAIAAIRSAVSSLGIDDNNMTVSLFETAHQRHHPNPNRSPLYRIVVNNDASDNLFLDIRTIGYFVVKIEKQKKSVAVQCRNCQRFHHTTNRCNFNFRCVQCATVHDYGFCPRATNPAIPIGGINCWMLSSNTSDTRPMTLNIAIIS